MAAVFADYHAALEQLTDDDIVTLWQAILMSHASGFAPTPGQCLKLLEPYRMKPDQARPPEHEQFRLEHSPVAAAERALVGSRLTRWRALTDSGQFWRMSHEATYDAVYGLNQPPAHKRQILENIAAKTAGKPRSPTRHLDAEAKGVVFG